MSGTVMHNLLNNVNLNARFASSTDAPNCVESVGHGPFLTSFRDEMFQDVELFFIPWFIALRIMND